MWSQFGFSNSITGSGSDPANDFRDVRATTTDGVIWVFSTFPIIPSTFTLDINGLIQDPLDGDFEINPDLKSLTWRGVPIITGYSLLASYTIAG